MTPPTPAPTSPYGFTAYSARPAVLEGALIEISNRDSAAACLVWVRELAARLDLDHPDAAYQAGKADQLARAAADLAHDLRVIATGRRLRRHLVAEHGRAELADRQQNADLWAGDHLADHRAGVPAGTAHPHEEGPTDGR